MRMTPNPTLEPRNPRHLLNLNASQVLVERPGAFHGLAMDEDHLGLAIETLWNFLSSTATMGNSLRTAF